MTDEPFRVLEVSASPDRTALVAVSGAVKPSLMNVRLSSVDPNVIASAVITVLREAAADLSAGAVVTIDDGARLHRLPLR